MKPLTPMQRRALELLSSGPMHRPRFYYEWRAGDGSLMSAPVIASLRKAGLVKVTRTRQRYVAELTTAGILTRAEAHQ